MQPANGLKVNHLLGGPVLYEQYILFFNQRQNEHLRAVLCLFIIGKFELIPLRLHLIPRGAADCHDSKSREDKP